MYFCYMHSPVAIVLLAITYRVLLFSLHIPLQLRFLLLRTKDDKPTRSVVPH